MSPHPVGHPHRPGAVAAALLGLACSLALAACGGSAGPAALTIRDAWARATPTGATNAAVYLTVTSPADDAITGVEVPRAIAADAQMHTSMVGDDGGSMANMPGMDHGSGAMATMRPLRRVALPAGRPVAFEPGHRHIMLTGLRRGLEDGDRFTLTVHFARAASRSVPVVVATNAPGS